MRRRARSTLAGLALVGLVTAAVVFQYPYAPAQVRIVSAHRATDSRRATLHVRSDAPGAIRLYSVELLARVGTNWAFVKSVPLGFTNVAARAFTVDVEPPDGRKQWKAKLVYMPEVRGIKRLR